MKVIIAGGRDFNDYNLLTKKCDKILKNFVDIEIVSGGANGADRLGEKYASERNHKIKLFPADWNRYGKSAGYKRNSQMADYADALIAFWDGTSKGTKHMIDLAKKAGLKVRVVKYMNTKQLLEIYDKKMNDDILERVLWKLLKGNEKNIGGLIESDQSGHWFHKSFRSMDVTGSGHIDSAIWTLLEGSSLFWKILDENIKDK